MNIKRLLITLVFILTAGVFLYASLGSITFEIVDGSGNPIADAEVLIEQLNCKNPATAEGKTGTDGTVTFTGLPYGNYMVTVTVPGHKPVVVSPVTVDATERRRLIAID